MTISIRSADDDTFRFLQDADSTIASSAPTMAPTADDLVSSTDSEIIRETFRVYGSIYLLFFLLFCVFRKTFPKLYNIRSWVPELKCNLAITQNYGFFSWSWKVFYITDDELLDNCGMDALCFLRCLRLGAKLSLLGVFNAMWLIPLYLTAEESPETAYLSDKFVLMSIANLPNQSNRFVGPVVALYVIVLCSIYLVSKEYDWFTEYRHKDLSKRVPRNYAVYVSGIPKDYRSSYGLAEYFRQCSWNAAVLEAHITMDIPSLEGKVARREKVLAKLEHTQALERKKGVTKTHRTIKRDGVKKVESAQAYKSELTDLNNEIALAIGEILNSNDRRRKNLTRSGNSPNVSNNNMQGNQIHSLQTCLTAHPSTLTIKTLDPNVGGQSEDSLISPPSTSTIGTINSPGSNTILQSAHSSVGFLDPIDEMPEPLNVPFERTVEGERNSLKNATNESEEIIFSSEDSNALTGSILTGSVPSTGSLKSQDVPFHPFLSMFGLDDSFLFQSKDELTGQLLLASGSIETTETAQTTRQAEESEDTSITCQDPAPEDNPEHPLNPLPKPPDIGLEGDSAGQETELQLRDPPKNESSRRQFPSFLSVRKAGMVSSSVGSNGSNAPSATHSARQAEAVSSSGGSNRSNASSVTHNVMKAGAMGVHSAKRIGAGTVVVGDAVASRMKRVSTIGAHGVKTAGSFGVTSVKKAADFGILKMQQAPDIGATLAASAAAVVPMRMNLSEGQPREAGFVVFNDLYTTQAARQMLQHPSGKSDTRTLRTLSD
jgi:hypothetical protein